MSEVNPFLPAWNPFPPEVMADAIFISDKHQPQAVGTIEQALALLTMKEIEDVGANRRIRPGPASK